MAEKENKYPQNVEGPYYVDESCIVCGICVSQAPDNFRFAEGDKYAYVHKQPTDEEQKEQAEEALEACPVDAIGNDG